MDLYAENILDHYRRPRHYGELGDATSSAAEANPLCGDKIRVMIKVGKDDLIEDAKFTGEGCAISTASMSMLMEDIIGKRVSDIMQIENEEICEKVGIPLTSARNKCALIGFLSVKKALKDA